LIAGAALFAAGAAQAAPQMTIPGFDPFDAAAVRTMDWAGIEQSPVWTAVPVAGPRQQPPETFTYRAVRSVTTQSERLLHTDIALEAARSGSGRHRVIVTVITADKGACAAIHDRLAAAYGAPAATRSSDSRKVDGKVVVEQHEDGAQWSAGTTSVTRSCDAIGLDGRTVNLIRVELEPALDAPRLAPEFALSCPGLPAGAKAGETTYLRMDPRERSIRVGEDDPELVYGQVDDGVVAFTPAGGRAIRIDRAGGAWTAEGGGSGVCTAAKVGD
jgi:hypothetical protein